MPSDPATTIIVLWLLLVGGAVGSFLNVVVYRLPIGLSIVHPPSRCPKCGNLIRWFDNVPVLAWLWLRGRCRQCGEPISARYPTVEAITAAMFGLVAAVELGTHGANLPHRVFAVAEGVLISESSMGQVYGIFLYHILLLCTLLCAGLIEFDGHRPPQRLFVPAWVVGFLMPLLWPALRPWAAWDKVPKTWAGAVDGVAGLAAGAMIAAIAWWIASALPSRTSGEPRRTKKRRPGVAARNAAGVTAGRGFVDDVGRGFVPVGGLLCMGLFLGWQAACANSAAAAVLLLLGWLVRRVWPRFLLPPSMALGVVTLAWILVWSRLASP